MNQLPLLIAADHPAFAGHFPGRPIVPGVVLLDHAQHAIESATGWRLGGVAVAKFLSPVGPGEALTVAYEAGEAGVRFQIAAADRQVANGRFALAQAPAPAGSGAAA